MVHANKIHQLISVARALPWWNSNLWAFGDHLRCTLIANTLQPMLLLLTAVMMMMVVRYYQGERPCVAQFNIRWDYAFILHNTRMRTQAINFSIYLNFFLLPDLLLLFLFLFFCLVDTLPRMSGLETNQICMLPSSHYHCGFSISSSSPRVDNARFLTVSFFFFISL